MAVALGRLEPAWRRAVHESSLAMVIVDLVDFEVVDANQAALDFFAARDGQVVDLDDHITIDERSRQVAELLLGGAVDSFEGRVRSRRPGDGGSELRVWVRALVREGEPRRFAIAVGVADDAGRTDQAIPLAVTRPDRMVAGATDEEWVCEWVTREVTALLGYARAEVIGMPLLGLAHPDVAADLVVALSHAGDGDGGTVLHARLRAASGEWRRVQMILSPRQEQGGAAFLLLPEAPPPPGRADVVDAEVHRTTAEADAVALARAGDWAGESLPELSSRQWEIVTRLRRGERVPGIAREMYLSQSTVRNHLIAVFRKFGVDSQAELLRCLRERAVLAMPRDAVPASAGAPRPDHPVG